MSQSTSEFGTTCSRRSMTVLGVPLLAITLVFGWWLSTGVGEYVTTLGVVLFVALWIMFMSVNTGPANVN
ncbi:hypothetical protein [Halanaeroarchaeum sulfurireducens]|uniref:hypothetical protein n=1 Tax=Halanaeroarchaeum sulfurireducens TaxID=1604004 RepID=UPI0011873C90|nr:hypothetical protein [Halanaeroarchaeum sulfurireducens]